ncbi:putative two-component system response regulator [Desulfomicrobium macestii]|uniref:Two-component system response regulator n=1 Tax=Desulfomicrobium macestii TaxID=90731 RepID=A0ABR9H5S2_9BACT|nr:HD domain-containing phosphohydrolase [Desulfomicrobium macestii]MBE1426045.1 putative two-component system response regulator [Desulfomicrobium macestii]
MQNQNLISELDQLHVHLNDEIDHYDEELDECRILIVDDFEINILVLIEALKSYSKISVSQDSKIAFDSLSYSLPDIVLLDLFMPDMNGFEICKYIKNNEQTSDIPIIFITSEHDPLSLSKAFELGAVDYIKKPFDTIEVNARLRTHLKLKIAERKLKEHNANLEIKVAERTKKLEEKNIELNEVKRETIFRLCLAAEMRDVDTGNHINRIQAYTEVIALKCGMSREEAEQLSLASSMHDLGKIGIPDHILLKPGKLTPEESEIMKQHTVIGARALADGKSDLLRVAHRVALSHHERWDGKGYPQGLRGVNIPIEARIVGLVDVFDALISRRAYKHAFTVDDAIMIILSEKGNHFDPKLVDIFIASLNEIMAIKDMFSYE